MKRIHPDKKEKNTRDGRYAAIPVRDIIIPVQAAWRGQQAGKSRQLRSKPQGNTAELHAGRQMWVVKQRSGTTSKILCHRQKELPVSYICCGALMQVRLFAA